MNTWQEELLDGSEDDLCEHAAFNKIEAAAQALGFEQCAFALQLPSWSGGNRALVLNNYPALQWRRYLSREFLQPDPLDSPGYCKLDPIVWSEKILRATHAVREEARVAGQSVGWLQSSAISLGLAGILTLSRSDEMLSRKALASRADDLRWLVRVSHITLCGIFVSRPKEAVSLTRREIDVLQWSAEGKTTGEVAQIMALSENTIKFHIKKSTEKLGSANKTAAVVRAVRIGLLN